MKTKEYQNKFYEEATQNYEGMYTLDLFATKMTDVQKLRRALNKAGLKTRIGFSGNSLFAINKKHSWTQYN